MIHRRSFLLAMPAILRPGLIMPIRVLPRQTLADFETTFANLIVWRNDWQAYWNEIALDMALATDLLNDYPNLGATKCHIDSAADR